jgi:hypothetical protein
MAGGVGAVGTIGLLGTFGAAVNLHDAMDDD